MPDRYDAIVISSPTDFITVISLDGTSYEEIIESQSSINYNVKKIYLQASTVIGVNEPIEVVRYDANGYLSNMQMLNLVEPYQYQTSKNIQIKNNSLILDGRTQLNVIVDANSTYRIYFQTTKIEPRDLLNNGKNFFSNDFLNTYGFFKNYNEEISDQIFKVKKELE